MDKRKFPRSAGFDPNTLTFDDLRAPDRQRNFETKNAVAYCRISSETQVKEWHWLESQQLACAWYAKDNNFNIKSFFEDEAISWSIINREWLLKLENYVKKENKIPWDNNIKYLLCTEVSRLSRPEFVDEWLEILFRFLKLWVTIVDVFSRQTINRDNDVEMIVALLKLSQAKAERQNIMNRTKNWAMQRLKQWYRCFPTVPTGYKYIKQTNEWKTNVIVVRDEPNASKIAEWLRLYANWTIYNKIDFVKYLKESWAITNKTRWDNNKIRNSVVYSFLKPERLLFYAGKIVSPRSWITIPIEWKHEALISQEILQKILERINKPMEDLPHKSDNLEYFPLRKILKCKTCWSTMYWSFVTWKTWKKFPYYECKNKDCELRKEWISRSCPQKKVHEEFRNLLKSFNIPDKEKDLVKLIAQRVIREKEKIKETVLDERNKQISIIQKDMDKIKSAMMWLNEPELITEYEIEWIKLNNQKIEINESIKNLKIWDIGENFYEHLEKTLKAFDNLVNIWDNHDLETKHLLVDIIFEWKLFYNKKEGLRTPLTVVRNWRFLLSEDNLFLMERVTRLELATVCLEGRHSSQLSYTRVIRLLLFLVLTRDKQLDENRILKILCNMINKKI